MSQGSHLCQLFHLSQLSNWSQSVHKLTGSRGSNPEAGLAVGQPGDPSYKLYAEEKEAQLDSLKRRAALVNKTLNALEGVTCNNPEGALYAMPRIRLPAAAVEVFLLPSFSYCALLSWFGSSFVSTG